jgi:hypothetical protein
MEDEGPMCRAVGGLHIEHETIQGATGIVHTVAAPVVSLRSSGAIEA